MSMRSIFSGLVIAMSFSIAIPVQAVVESGLWLPVSYRPHYLKLVQAAKLVEDHASGCVTVIRGELKSGISTKEHPIFRLVCRNDKKRSFAVIIDGLAMEVIDPAYPGGTVSFEELAQLRALELKRQEKEAEREAARQELLRQEKLWLDCDTKVAARTKMMKSIKMLSEGSPEADLSEEGHVKYTVDFDAKGMQGKHLRYRAQCDFNADDKLTFKIRPRRTAQKGANP
mgnify:CR=1 FL=1